MPCMMKLTIEKLSHSARSEVAESIYTYRDSARRVLTRPLRRMTEKTQSFYRVTRSTA
ncbi:hypothetical protein CCP3SC5AM1_780006 [Gammaproteobacteria bacterium]